MPENNFSMSDLDPRIREQLIAGKPELKGLLGYYEEEGMTDRVLDMLDQQLRQRDLPEYDAYDAANREFVLSRYRDLEQFISVNGDDLLEQLLQLRERAEDAHSDLLTVKAKLDDDTVRRFLELLPARVFADIARSVTVVPAERSAHREAARRLTSYGGPVFDQIEQVFEAASGHEVLVRALDERIAEYVREGWVFECTYAWAVLPNSTELIGSAIEVQDRRG